MSGAQSWMLYGAAGHTGAVIAQHARKRGHQPILAGRNAAAVAALAERLDLPHRAVRLDDPAALSAALDGMELVLMPPGRSCAPRPRSPKPAWPQERITSTSATSCRCSALSTTWISARSELASRSCPVPGSASLPPTACGPVRQRRSRRRAAPRSRRPGRRRPARPRHRGIRASEPPLRRLDPPSRPPAPLPARLRNHSDPPPRRAMPRHALPHR